ncbi:reverse transcriptase [Phytophthora megakarya]|uniref:Reverse transcriptase n=1 Tax=Phytophthora megakarya TaxID=4795 RepID=A0A225W5V0_9STRA|nr:reverse transcriptase [Phytophthora megakarya]
MPKVEYLGHKVSHNGQEANPKDLSALTDLAFPGSLRAMQSFLGSLNYYSRFIEDYAIYASVLYELQEIDFAAMMKEATQVRIQQVLETENVDQGSPEDQVVDHRKTLDLDASDLTEVDPRWIHAHPLFSVLKANLAATPILRHFDPDRRAAVVVYASDWAISGSLIQEYDQIYSPVMFASRTLKSNELGYGIAEKGVLVLLMILDLNYNALVGCPIHVLTRHSIWRGPSDPQPYMDWAALLSPWTLEVTKCVKGEDEILGALAASITPRSEVDKALTSIAPKKEPRRKIQAPVPTIRCDEELYVVSFDGSARGKRGGGAYSAILWKLPEWRVLKARYGYAEGLTDLLEDLDPRRLVICGDSNLVIRQVRGEIDCKAPGLTLLRQRALDRLRAWPDHELLHVKRDWNGSADSLASAVLQRQCGIEVETEEEIQDLVTLNRLDEILIDEESWISGLKKYLVGEIRDLTQEDAKVFGSIAINYEVDQSDLLFYCPTTKKAAADRDKLMRLVIPGTLQQDILHHYHTSLQGGHQGIGRTYDRIRDHFHWRGLATYPFQIIVMDHIPSLPRSFNGNTELLIFVDLFSGIFGASEVIRHDREPGFMSDFFESFNKILGQRQRATMAYRPQANGSAEHWDEYAERLTFVINTARDRIRGETLIYMIHGWDPRSTLEAVIPVGSTRRHDRDPRRWRYQMQKYYQQSREQVNQRLREAIVNRADTHNDLSPDQESGCTWIDEVGDRRINIQHLPGSACVKLVKIFPNRPVARLEQSEGDRVDFDEVLYLKAAGSRIEIQMNTKWSEFPI